METIKIIIVDDHQIIRDGIEAMLLSEDKIKIIGTAHDYNALIKIPDYQNVDLIILDISLPDKSGIEIAREFSEKFENIKILMLSANTTEKNIIESIKAGANGFLHKDTSSDEFIEAIKSICNGEEYFGEKLSKIIYKSYISHVKYKPKPTQVKLSEREIEVIKLLSDGLSSKEIANKLFISPRTVESHKSNILSKLNLNNNIEIVKFAIKEGVVKL